MTEMKSILVIGMGIFGRHLATKMLELGNDVMIVDRSEEIVEQLAPMFTDAQIGDCTNRAVLESLDVPNFDICFVTIGEKRTDNPATALKVMAPRSLGKYLFMYFDAKSKCFRLNSSSRVSSTL